MEDQLSALNLNQQIGFPDGSRNNAHVTLELEETVSFCQSLQRLVTREDRK
jgi:hypothetical protein